MISNDSRFREELKKGIPQMPKEVAEQFDDTVSSFRHPAPRKKTVFKAVRYSAAISVLVLFILLNIFPTVAYAMQEIPLLGDIVRVFTIFKAEDTRGNHYRDIKIPHLEGSGIDVSAIDYINADVETLTMEVLKEYETLVANLPEAHTGVVIDYDVMTNTSRWFTLRLMLYRDAGSSSVQYYFYHIDKQNGTIVGLSDLFREDFDYQTVISQEILIQMKKRQQENPNMTYWTEKNNNPGLAFKEIARDQNFYFNEEGDMVIVFGKYEVAPGYMGCPEFVIPLQIYEKGIRIAS